MATDKLSPTGPHKATSGCYWSIISSKNEHMRDRIRNGPGLLVHNNQLVHNKGGPHSVAYTAYQKATRFRQVKMYLTAIRLRLCLTLW